LGGAEQTRKIIMHNGDNNGARPHFTNNGARPHFTNNGATYNGARPHLAYAGTNG